jgi:signal transduction histidine kinase
MGLNSRCQPLRQRVLLLMATSAGLELALLALSCIWEEQRSTLLSCALAGFAFFATAVVVSAAILKEVSRLEADIRQTQDQLALLRSRQHELTATVNEELLDPMMSIALSLAAVSDGSLGAVPQSVVDEIQSAEERSTRLMLLLNDLLERQRLDSGKLVLDRRKLPISEPLQKAVESVEYLALQKNVQIRHEADKLDVLGDSGKLAKVALNLLASALQEATPQSVIEVQTRDLGDLVEVRIRSTAARQLTAHEQPNTTGQPNTHGRSNASDRFETGGPTSKASPQRDGNHPGLAFCKAIIDAHGGRIGVASDKDGVNTFWFRVPKPKERDPQGTSGFN